MLPPGPITATSAVVVPACRTGLTPEPYAQELLDAVEVLAAAAVDGREDILQRPLAERLADQVVRHVLPVEDQFRDLVLPDRGERNCSHVMPDPDRRMSAQMVVELDHVSDYLLQCVGLGPRRH